MNGLAPIVPAVPDQSLFSGVDSILAIDAASRTGWAFLDVTSGICSGSVDFRKAGCNGALHMARVHCTMDNPFHKGMPVWQTAGGQYLYNMRTYVGLSEALLAHAVM